MGEDGSIAAGAEATGRATLALRQTLLTFEQRKRGALDAGAKGVALHKFGSEKMSLAFCPEFKNRQNVRVIQGGRGKGFLLEPLQPLFILCDGFG